VKVHVWDGSDDIEYKIPHSPSGGVGGGVRGGWGMGWDGGWGGVGGGVGWGGGGWEFIGMTELNKWTPSIRPIRDNNSASSRNIAKLQYFNSVAHFSTRGIFWDV
jgi:hypothetical protein